MINSLKLWGVRINSENKNNKKVCDNSENEKSEKIEKCYFCLKEFDINKDDSSHYKYGKYPMCAYCSEFYGFYSD
jgi:hypothetical protein